MAVACGKIGNWFGLALLVCLGSLALAQEAEKTASPPGKPAEPSDITVGQPPAKEIDHKLGVDLSASVVSKYIWRGFDILDDHAAFQPGTTVELFGTGFSFNIWGSWALDDRDELDNFDELDYTPAYNYTFFADERYAVDFGVNYIYYNLYRTNRSDDTQEAGGSLALPNLIPLGPSNLVPKYYFGYLWPVQSEGNDDLDGGYHNLALTYELPLKDDWSVGFLGDVAYNDGQFGVDHDWSHSTLGVSLNIPVGPVQITPFVNYQFSFEDTVNPDDEVYGGVTATFSF